MKQLATLQHRFQNYVLDPGTTPATDWISNVGRAAPQIQLSIYTHAYAARLQEVLANDYPAMLLAIGEDRFTRLADDYLRAHPSRYFSLRDFGRHLPDFLCDPQQQAVDKQDIPWLHELALFEWTLGEAFDAQDATVATLNDIATVSPEAWAELKFTLHPCVHRLDLEWNIPQMWQALMRDNPVPVAAVPAATSEWLIWREQLVTRFRSLPSDERRALDALGAGGNFGEVCEALATVLPEEQVPSRIVNLLKGWIAQGLISTIE